MTCSVQRQPAIAAARQYGNWTCLTPVAVEIRRVAAGRTPLEAVSGTIALLYRIFPREVQPATAIRTRLSFWQGLFEAPLIVPRSLERLSRPLWTRTMIHGCKERPVKDAVEMGLGLSREGNNIGK